MVPLVPTSGILGSASSTPDFSTMPTTAAVTAALTGVTPPDAIEDLRGDLRRGTRASGAARGTASRIVGTAVLARTMAVLVFLAMAKCYHCPMTGTTASDLLGLAERDLAEAQEIMGLPSPEVGPSSRVVPSDPDFEGGLDLPPTATVSGGTWDDVAARAKELLRRAWDLRPVHLGAKAGAKIRDAARRGLDKASGAAKDVRDTLGQVALGAAMLAASPGILLGLAVFLLIEGTGYGGRARAAGRRYVSQRARAYGF